MILYSLIYVQNIIKLKPTYYVFIFNHRLVVNHNSQFIIVIYWRTISSHRLMWCLYVCGSVIENGGLSLAEQVNYFVPDNWMVNEKKKQ
jgi:hypothetical protein